MAMISAPNADRACLPAVIFEPPYEVACLRILGSSAFPLYRNGSRICLRPPGYDRFVTPYESCDLAILKRELRFSVFVRSTVSLIRMSRSFVHLAHS